MTSTRSRRLLRWLDDYTLWAFNTQPSLARAPRR